MLMSQPMETQTSTDLQRKVVVKIPIKSASEAFKVLQALEIAYPNAPLVEFSVIEE